MKEEKYLAAMINGDTKALGKLMDAYSGYVYTIARNFSRGVLSNEDIDEIFSDVFYRLWKSRDKLDAEIGIHAYLSAITRNAVKDRLKSAARGGVCEDIDELELSSGALVEENTELREMMRCLKEALSRLSDEERDIFLRYYLYGETTARIASEKNAANGAVRTRLSRIRAKLRSYMNERGFENV